MLEYLQKNFRWYETPPLYNVLPLEIMKVISTPYFLSTCVLFLLPYRIPLTSSVSQSAFQQMLQNMNLAIIFMWFKPLNGINVAKCSIYTTYLCTASHFYKFTSSARSNVVSHYSITLLHFYPQIFQIHVPFLIYF